MNARQFLLCSVNIRNKKAWSEFSIATAAKRKAELLLSDWEPLDEEHLRYKESVVRDFCYRDALRYARNFHLLSCKTINHAEILSREIGCLTLTGRDVSLIVDTHGNFLFIICYQLTSRPETNALDAIDTLFKNRSVIDNIGDRDWYIETQCSVKTEIARYVNKALGTNELSADKIELNSDAAFPLFVADAEGPANFGSLFSNEENIEQRTENSPLSRDYSGSYFHIGWNYTLVLGFPREVNEHIFALLTKMQMSYYKFRYYKEHFEETFNDLFRNEQMIDSSKVDYFDRLQLNYRDFLSNYYKFKLGLFPKFYTEMDRVEKLWHVDKDMELMSGTFAAQAEFVNKKHSDISQKTERKQNQALNVIALLQILAFMSVIYDSLQFKGQWPALFNSAVAFIALSLTIIVWHYLDILRIVKIVGKLILARFWKTR